MLHALWELCFQPSSMIRTANGTVLVYLIPLREALHSNRWKQPELEQMSGDFLAKKYLTGDPVRMYVALRIWNEYLKAREPRDRESVCERFIEKNEWLYSLIYGQSTP